MTSAATEPVVTPATQSVIASVRDLRVHFRSKAGTVHAVDGVNFDIRDGETLGLVGETGCGKSVTAMPRCWRHDDCGNTSATRSPSKAVP